MTNVEKQIIETWRINNRTNVFMIANIPTDGMNATLSSRGGRNVARQFAHLHTVRVRRLESFARKSRVKLITFESKESPSKKKLIQAFKQSGDLMEKYMLSCLKDDGTVPNFKRGLVPMLGYYIHHEAHHRGSIVLTLKQSGIKIPDTLKWGIWEWNKI